MRSAYGTARRHRLQHIFAQPGTDKNDLHRSVIDQMFLIAVIFLCQRAGGTLAGSRMDWFSQSTAIASWFRMRFYETHNFFPQFAASLGGGQNIWYFAYYGLYNPVYMLSWLFQKCSMETWFLLIGIMTHAADGFCMALADSVPGVSGGTVAFILGFCYVSGRQE
ncbi:MAG: DUF368 domain-containing protein [Solobacterium sp.]|nr:DUF368 domain-containing protein [Solobacterium sp.]